jgi:hypothetical protein
MVDPLEAKRLAARQMQEFRATEKLKVHCFCIECIILFKSTVSRRNQHDNGLCFFCLQPNAFSC